MATFTVKERATGGAIYGPWQIYETLKKLGRADQAGFWAVGVDKRNREIVRACVQKGGIDGLQADPKLVFRRLLKRGVTAWVAAVHYASGRSEASEEDRRLTEALSAASGVVGLHFLDYVIIGEEGYFSFALAGRKEGGSCTRS